VCKDRLRQAAETFVAKKPTPVSLSRPRHLTREQCVDRPYPPPSPLISPRLWPFIHVDPRAPQQPLMRVHYFRVPDTNAQIAIGTEDSGVAAWGSIFLHGGSKGRGKREQVARGPLPTKKPNVNGHLIGTLRCILISSILDLFQPNFNHLAKSGNVPRV